jgi:alpha-amylase
MISKKWTHSLLILLISISLLVAGCQTNPQDGGVTLDTPTDEEAQDKVTSKEPPKLDGLISHWPNAVFYEIFVRAFYDSNGDGIGDIKGMTEKLDYLKELGVEGIWLMPINPSPSYHGYDVTDYYGIDPKYGTLEDFKTFIQEAHTRDIKVIMDLVVNHSSSEHPWFKDALSSKDSPYRDWYIWADDNTNIFERGEWNQQVWHGSGDNRYYGVFWEGMPDLNFNNPEVRKQYIDIGQFWLDEVGVDGFRLDAAKHIFSKKEEENHAWWQEFRAAMQEVQEDVFLVGEVWAPATVVGPYLKDGLHSAFNFDLSSKIISAAQSESDTGIASSLERVRAYFLKQSEEYVDSTFITNHDMNRVMTQLRGNVDHAKMAASLLLTLPGSPFLYYGEEIGMEGEKPDEHIREPMLWYNKPKGTGQTSWIRARHNTGVDAPTVEAQLEDENSLYNHYKTMIYARRSSDILVQGGIERSRINKSGIVAFKRVLEEESLLVLHNMTGEHLSIVLQGNEVGYSIPLFSSNEETTVESTTDQVNLNLSPYSTLILEEK